MSLPCTILLPPTFNHFPKNLAWSEPVHKAAILNTGNKQAFSESIKSFSW